MISTTPSRTSRRCSARSATRCRPLSPETLQLRVLDALRRLVLALVERGPLVIAIEDLHWADASTLHALRLLLPEGRGHLAPVRPDDPGRPRAADSLTGAASERAEVIELAPLPDDRVDELVASLLEGDAIPAELLGRVVETSGGNPFFLSELIRSLVGSGALVRRGDHVGRDRRREHRAADDDREGDPGSARRAPDATPRRAHRRVGAGSCGRPAPARASDRSDPRRRGGRARARRPVRTRRAARRAVVLACPDPGGRVRVAAEAAAARAPRGRRRRDRGAVAGADRRVPRPPRASITAGAGDLEAARRWHDLAADPGRAPARGRRGARAPHRVDRARGRARPDARPTPTSPSASSRARGSARGRATSPARGTTSRRCSPSPRWRPTIAMRAHDELGFVLAGAADYRVAVRIWRRRSRPRRRSATPTAR